MKNNYLVRITFLFLLIVFLKAQDPCTPLWPRMEFGSTFSDFSSEQKMIIKFNTKQACQQSYVVLSKGQGSIRKVFCQSSNLRLSQQMSNYQIFQQRCSISEIEFEQKIQYIVYGANSSSKSIPFSSIPIQSSIINPNTTKPVKLIVLADWGELVTKVNIYTSINSTLDTIRRTMDVNGIVINGDIAYDLDTNDGRNFQNFMNILSRIARYLPVFINTGNHEHLSDDDLNIFYFTFQQYGKDKNLAAGLNLGPIYLVGFDPYDSLYFQKVERNLKRQTSEVLQTQAYLGLKEILENSLKSNRTIITSSHYPMVCSAPDIKCTFDQILLKDFFDLMFTYNVKLYLGAHVHSYQRIYPYCSNDTYITKQSPFHFDSKEPCITAIIEGTAGNDNFLVTQYESIKPFTAKVDFGKTGVGVVEVGGNSIKYQHFSSENLLTLKDQIKMVFHDNGQETEMRGTGGVSELQQ